MTRFNFLRTRALLVKKIVSGIIVTAVAYLVYSQGLSESFAKSAPLVSPPAELIDELLTPYPAPPIAGITDWIPSSPLNLEALKGKVVLIDFWAYSCINCVRALPHLAGWYKKYHDKGLVIVGVHSPEFDFEKNLDNVKHAVLKNKIPYPVALDDTLTTWTNYDNHYWPALYLIDKEGYVVYQHFGEGHYDITENNIRALLKLSALGAPPSIAPTEKVSESQTPEAYLGFDRADHFASPDRFVKDEIADYTFPVELSEHDWALQGPWTISLKKITSARKDSALKIHFNAAKVYFVMGSASDTPIKVTLRLNGKPLTKEKGRDVLNSAITVKKHTVYEAVALPRASSGELELTAGGAGLEVFMITFGG